MKRLIFLSLAFFLLNLIMPNAQPFGPPLYIANPATMECKYYFAGNEMHFNPRPDNFTINIGYTTDFKTPDQACEFFRCVYTNGTVKVYQDKKPIDKDLCLCNGGSYWNNETGCVRIPQKEEPKQNSNILKRFWHWLRGGICGS